MRQFWRKTENLGVGLGLVLVAAALFVLNGAVLHRGLASAIVAALGVAAAIIAVRGLWLISPLHRAFNRLEARVHSVVPTTPNRAWIGIVLGILLFLTSMVASRHSVALIVLGFVGYGTVVNRNRRVNTSTDDGRNG